jgi:hypothetical protein
VQLQRALEVANLACETNQRSIRSCRKDDHSPNLITLLPPSASGSTNVGPTPGRYGPNPARAEGSVDMLEAR